MKRVDQEKCDVPLLLSLSFKISDLSSMFCKVPLTSNTTYLQVEGCFLFIAFNWCNLHVTTQSNKLIKKTLIYNSAKAKFFWEKGLLYLNNENLAGEKDRLQVTFPWGWVVLSVWWFRSMNGNVSTHLVLVGFIKCHKANEWQNIISDRRTKLLRVVIFLKISINFLLIRVLT